LLDFLLVEAIQLQPVTVYTSNPCSFCENAKSLLRRLEIPFNEISLTNNPTLRAEISAKNGGWRTVPMIMIGDEFIGGFQELSALHSAGGLVPRVKRGG
jgi:glutaredoxin 3